MRFNYPKFHVEDSLPHFLYEKKKAPPNMKLVEDFFKEQDVTLPKKPPKRANDVRVAPAVPTAPNPQWYYLGD